MGKRYETQDRRPLDAANETAYVWRCARCGRFLARIERLDGVLEVYHKCGEMNRLVGVVSGTRADGEKP
jgi:phage FluMu protein Com